MKSIKLLKSILIPALGITSIGIIPVVSTSCGEVHVSSVSLDKTSTTIGIGDAKTLSATILPENATDKTVIWSSNNESVATVDANGTITAVAEGTATITVTTNDGDKAVTCKVNVIDLSRYIGITANADSTLTLDNSGDNNPNLQYLTDGKSWSAYSTTIEINQGETLYLKGNNPTGWSQSANAYSCFSIDGNVFISGNVMGLLDNGAKPGEEGDITDIPCNYCFYELFRESTGITSVSEDFLPATTLKKYCYGSMFSGCTSLTTAPDLPAMTLTEGCYQYMFGGCSALTTAPEPPATSLHLYCYQSMFDGCTSLTTAPKLPATRLADKCYYCMFVGCSALTTAPELPATNLAILCYAYMFNECTSLTTAPELPATTLKDHCYSWIFYGCKKLNLIKIGYTGDYDSTYFNAWVSGVADSGTFYYNGTTQTAEDFKLPSGWTTEKF